MAVYNSNYTGAQVDAAVGKVSDITKTAAQINDLNQVNANPTLAGTEAALEGIEVGTTKYKVEQPINVVANPTLAGTEAALEGIEVGATKYKVSSGSDVYVNNIFMQGSYTSGSSTVYQDIITTVISKTPITTVSELMSYIDTYGVLYHLPGGQSNTRCIPATGYAQTSSSASDRGTTCFVGRTVNDPTSTLLQLGVSKTGTNMMSKTAFNISDFSFECNYYKL